MECVGIVYQAGAGAELERLPQLRLIMNLMFDWPGVRGSQGLHGQKTRWIRWIRERNPNPLLSPAREPRYNPETP